MKNQKSAVAVNARKAYLPTKTPELPSARRVKDLLSRMTLEEKAAQMMCVWQSKAETMLDAEGNFDFAEGEEVVSQWPRTGTSGPAERCRRRQRCPQHGRADQCHPEILPREQPSGNSGDVSRGVPARARCAGRNKFSAAHCAGSDLQPRAGGVAVHDDGSRSASARRASRTHTGGRRGPRASLGACRGDLWRRSLTSFRDWESRQCAASRETRTSGTSSMCWPRSSTLWDTGSRNRA